MKIFVNNHVVRHNLSKIYDNPLYYINNVHNPNNLDNINDLNDVFSEYCTHYLVWKNQCLWSDIVCCCHYRRLIKPEYINVEKIKNKNSIQYFYSYKFDHYVETFSVHMYQYYIEKEYLNYVVDEFNDFCKNYNDIKFEPSNYTFSDHEGWDHYKLIACETYTAVQETFNKITKCCYDYLMLCANNRGCNNLYDFANYIRQSNKISEKRAFSYGIEHLISACIQTHDYFQDVVLDPFTNKIIESS